MRRRRKERGEKGGELNLLQLSSAPKKERLLLSGAMRQPPLPSRDEIEKKKKKGRGFRIEKDRSGSSLINFLSLCIARALQEKSVKKGKGEKGPS